MRRADPARASEGRSDERERPLPPLGSPVSVRRVTAHVRAPPTASRVGAGPAQRTVPVVPLAQAEDERSTARISLPNPYPLARLRLSLSFLAEKGKSRRPCRVPVSRWLAGCTRGMPGGSFLLGGAFYRVRLLPGQR